MKILVINTGSSSIKYQLFDMDADRENVLVAGLVEKIGEDISIITHKTGDAEAAKPAKTEQLQISDHAEGMTRVVERLTDPLDGVIRDKSEIDAVGHRVVHGGESFQASTIINEPVMAAIRENIPLAPLHNPPNLIGIEVSQKIFPHAPQVAVFDTAFHHSMPAKAYLYVVPYELYSKHRVRRYGFHGTSHAYVAEAAAGFLSISLEKMNLVTIHLGNGASMTAVKGGKSIDTTMGMTPLEGLVMGTRSGDIDPALPFFLADHLKLSWEDIDHLLNKKSGMKGLCGNNDMRRVEEMAESGDKRAVDALEVYAYRIKKYLGAYYAALGHLDALVFTAGIGENSPTVRELCCRGLEELGIVLDQRKNREKRKDIRAIHRFDSKIKVLVVPTNEEKRIASETKRIVDNLR